MAEFLERVVVVVDVSGGGGSEVVGTVYVLYNAIFVSASSLHE